MTDSTAFHLTVRSDKTGIITIDVPNEKMNTLKSAFASQIRDILQQVKQQQLTGLVIISGKPDSFIAGADINMIDACKNATDAQMLARQGQQLMAEISALSIPVVAAIHGACLGGGLELALACDYRICTSDEKTRLGLPEVQLGLLPGAGGTQRLPRLVGVTQALDLILNGKTLRAKQAQRIGLVDEVVPASILQQTAIDFLRRKKRSAQPLSLQERVLRSPPGMSLIFRLAERRVRIKTRGNYPAAYKILSVIRTGIEQGMRRGLDAEAEAFGKLAVTRESVALRSLFFATTAMKKEKEQGAKPRKTEHLGVLGGGLMGGGIASVTATKAGLPVRIQDIRTEGVSHAIAHHWNLLTSKVKRKHLTPAERQRMMSNVTGCTDFSGFSQCDIVIEAVFEELALKQQMVADIEQRCAPHTLFASNTSSLPIGQIAAHAQRPENVIGLHYFSPVDKMPLVEVIPHAGTSSQSIATVIALARKQGKTPVVVADSAGFYVNRILTPYLTEALHCLLSGEPVDKIDDALMQFGFPLGPIQLLDEVGLDVGAKIIPVLQQAFGERFTAPPALDALLKDGRKGKKNQRGFYLYPSAKSGKKRVDPDIYTLLNLQPEGKLDQDQIARRCVMLMLNEAVRCHDEGVIRSVRDGDIGAVMGIGFPPFLGGPFRYIDQLGSKSVVKTLEQFSERYGERFTPCEALCRMAESDGKFCLNESRSGS